MTSADVASLVIGWCVAFFFRVTGVE